MIAKLSGRLDSTGEDWAIVDVGGVGYLVHCSSRTLAALGEVGEGCTVHTQLQVSENDMRLLDPHTYAVYAQKYPQITQLPLIGQATEQSVSAEQILALKPDLAIFSIAGEGPTQHSPVADLLAKAGVPVLFIDFRVHPIRNTRVSMQALGTLLGREARAQQYLSLYDRHLKRVTEGVAGLPDNARPKVFLELLAGVWQAPGHTTGKSGLGSVVEAVGEGVTHHVHRR